MPGLISPRVSAVVVVAMMALFAAPRQTQADVIHLKAVGSLGASHIYTTYGYIGVLADSFVKDVYTAEKIEELMKEVKGIVTVNVKNLNALKEAGLSESDVKSVNQMLEIYKMLDEQADHLTKFAQTRDREHAQNFEKTRKAVWPKIAALLGIDKS